MIQLISGLVFDIDKSFFESLKMKRPSDHKTNKIAVYSSTRMVAIDQGRHRSRLGRNRSRICPVHIEGDYSPLCGACMGNKHLVTSIRNHIYFLLKW